MDRIDRMISAREKVIERAQDELRRLREAYDLLDSMDGIESADESAEAPRRLKLGEAPDGTHRVKLQTVPRRAGPGKTTAAVLDVLRSAGRPMRQADVSKMIGSEHTITPSVTKLIRGGQIRKTGEVQDRSPMLVAIPHRDRTPGKRDADDGDDGARPPLALAPEPKTRQPASIRGGHTPAGPATLEGKLMQAVAYHQPVAASDLSDIVGERTHTVLRTLEKLKGEGELKQDNAMRWMPA